MKIKLLRYIIMVTKFTFYGVFLQTLLFSMLMASEVSGQKTLSIKEVTINLNLNDVSIEEAFRAIERKSNYIFQYDSKVIDTEIRIDLNGRNETIADYLLLSLKKSKATFQAVESFHFRITNTCF